MSDDGGLPYLVMQYVAGQSLQQKIDRRGPLSLNEILRIGTQVAGGLAAAHAQGLVHRDIKPANILLENGVERAQNHGLRAARAIDKAPLTEDGTLAGTPNYMSPSSARRAARPADGPFQPGKHALRDVYRAGAVSGLVSAGCDTEGQRRASEANCVAQP